MEVRVSDTEGVSDDLIPCPNNEVTAVPNALNQLTPIDPFLMFSGAGASKAEAFDVASYYTLIGLGYKT